MRAVATRKLISEPPRATARIAALAVRNLGKGPHWFCWNTDNHCSVFDVCSHDTSGTDYRSSADPFHRRKHDGTGAEPHVVPDFQRRIFDLVEINRVVIVRVNSHSLRYQSFVTDHPPTGI